MRGAFILEVFLFYLAGSVDYHFGRQCGLDFASQRKSKTVEEITSIRRLLSLNQPR
jgi:hypothetical protein